MSIFYQIISFTCVWSIYVELVAHHWGSTDGRPPLSAHRPYPNPVLIQETHSQAFLALGCNVCFLWTAQDRSTWIGWHTIQQTDVWARVFVRAGSCCCCGPACLACVGTHVGELLGLWASCLCPCRIFRGGALPPHGNSEAVFFWLAWACTREGECARLVHP
jgi:hypothetical protein